MWKRRSRAGLLGLALAAVSVLALPSTAGAVPVTNACKNSVTANNTQLGTDTSGAAPASVASGGSVPLSGIHQSAAIPGSVFVTGYNLNLLDDGDTVPANIRTVIEGTNTAQGVQSTAPVDVSVGPIDITDPDAMRGTGDESAADGAIDVTYPDLNWTAGGPGVIEFREDTVTPLAANTGGVVIIATVGVIQVQFRCSPGTVTGPDPGTITFIDPAPAFASTQVASAPAPTTNPRCATLRKKLKKAKKKHDKAKVKKIRKQLRKLGC
jgi:hypothetical protein